MVFMRLFYAGRLAFRFGLGFISLGGEKRRGIVTYKDSRRRRSLRTLDERGDELGLDCTWEDDTHSVGSIGFRAGGGEHCLYDNVLVTTATILR